MNTRKRSPIWFIPKDKLLELINKSNTIAEVLSFFNMKNHGGNFNTLMHRLKMENIDATKFHINQGKIQQFRKIISLESLLVINCKANRGHIKKKLIKNGLLIEQCAICNLQPIWQNKKLVLILDHINGINNDYRLENLRLLCPNCNSQTDTFAGKNIKYNKQFIYCKCGNVICNKKVKLCRICYGLSRRKVIRPSKEELELLIWKYPIIQIAKQYKVADTAVHKWIKSYNITNKPKHGYFLQGRLTVGQCSLKA